MGGVVPAPQTIENDMLSVLIATRNRAGLLDQTLAAYRNLAPPSGGWKLIVVDNGSIDDTATVIRKWQRLLPIDHLHEPLAGKNRALNTALDRIEGDLAVFADDDMAPSKDWLVTVRAAADAREDFDVFAGRILPAWPPECPAWIKSLTKQQLASAFGVTWPDLRPGEIKWGLAFGGNMAVRASHFRVGVRFDAGMGPKPGDYAMGGETELLYRLARAGARTWYCRDAVSYHRISPAQVTVRWLIGRSRRQGRGRCRLDMQRGRSRIGLSYGFLPRGVTGYVARAYWSGALSLLCRDPARAVHWLEQAEFTRGYYNELMRGKFMRTSASAGSPA